MTSLTRSKSRGLFSVLDESRFTSTGPVAKGMDICSTAERGEVSIVSAPCRISMSSSNPGDSTSYMVAPGGELSCSSPDVITWTLSDSIKPPESKFESSLQKLSVCFLRPLIMGKLIFLTLSPLRAG
uniref:Uncharacterized protein n=1 Tax=Cacopsylla melanoneura TaxID=428564 RepID=A0A8D8R0C8_9HEMI